MRRLTLCVLALAATVSAAFAADGPQGDTFRSIALLPDFTGVWTIQNFANPGRSKDVVPLTAAYAARLEKTRALNRTGGDVPSPTYHCVPNGFPMMMAAPIGTYEFLMQPGFLLINGERNNETRRIFTDGRPHPRDWKPNFYGHSSGHWEGGKVLVADTVGTLPQLQLFYGFVGAGDTEVTERFSLPQADTIHIDTAIKDSAFTKPYTYARDYKRQPGWVMMEDYCAQNNRDVDNKTGMQGFDAKPPPLP